MGGIIFCLKFKNKVKIALFMKFNLSFGKRLEIHNRAYDIFIVYQQDSEDDELFVANKVIPLLKKHGLSVATEDSFPPGRNRFECLQAFLTQSCTALIIITQDLLKENLKLYDLNQAVCTHIQHKNFKVVFLLCRKPIDLGKLPKNLRSFLQTGPTVKQFKKNWENALVYELKHKTGSLGRRQINGAFHNNQIPFEEANLMEDQL